MCAARRLPASAASTCIDSLCTARTRHTAPACRERACRRRKEMSYQELRLASSRLASSRYAARRRASGAAAAAAHCVGSIRQHAYSSRR
jgi:hypothetical protein